MLDCLVDHRIQRALTAATGLTNHSRPRRLAWFCALLVFSLTLQALVSFPRPTSTGLPAGWASQSLAEALELDDDEPQFNPATSPACLSTYQLAPAPAAPHLTPLALTPLTPPPPSA